MDENLHDIDRLFKDSIEAHEEMPSENLWNAIDNNLDKSNVIDIKRKYNNLRRLAVVLLLLLLGTLVYEIQSKKPSKEVLAKNNAGSNKEINNNQREKTKQYNEEHTLNGSGSAPSATNMVKSGNTEMSTAGNDSLNNTVQHINKNTRQKTAEEVQQRAIVKVLNSKSKYEPAQNVANENMPEPQGSRSPIKKSSIHKTRITVINAAAEEMLTEKTGTEKNAIDKAAISGGSNELTALQKDKVEKITEPGQT